MTRGDFILGVISSLVATTLFELARKYYPKLHLSSIIRLSKGLFRIFTTPNLSVRILSSSIVLVLTISVTLDSSVRTVFAPTEDLKSLQLEQSSLEGVEPRYEKAKRLAEPLLRLAEIHAALQHLETPPDTTKRALDLLKKRKYRKSSFTVPNKVDYRQYCINYLA